MCCTCIFDKADVYCDGKLVFVKTYEVCIGVYGLGVDRNLSKFFNDWLDHYDIDPNQLTKEDVEVFKFDLTLHIERINIHGKEKIKLLSISS